LLKQTELFVLWSQEGYALNMDETKKDESRDPRSEIMRDKLLSATLDVILSEGWTGTSTPKICKEAGVSRGAQTHHFPKKSELMMASLQRVATDHESAIADKVSQISSKDRSLKAVLRAIWESCQDDRFMQPSLEAMVASRTDQELCDHVAPRDKQAIRSMRSLACEVVDTSLNEEQIGDIIELSIYLFRGIAVERGMHDDDRFCDGLFDIWYNIIANFK